MATYNNINELFKDICDRLREKLGTTDLIKHNEIAEKISSIPTGGASYDITNDWSMFT